jgi:hypothetical protein
VFLTTEQVSDFFQFLQGVGRTLLRFGDAWNYRCGKGLDQQFENAGACSEAISNSKTYSHQDSQNDNRETFRNGEQLCQVRHLISQNR